MTEQVVVTDVDEQVIVQEVDDLVVVSEVGIQGPQGAPGASVGGFHHHIQASPSATWTIVHNLGFFPGGIYVLDTSGSQWVPTRSDPDINTIILGFPGAMGGTADLS